MPVVKEGLLNVLPEAGERTGWPWTTETDPSIYTGRRNWPKITIVTPSYNQGQFIEQTIRSVLLQNYPNLEYIIIDGGSSDQTKEILQKYAPWISYWQSEKDHGQGHAINLGFSLASGNYYAWINSDDYYLSNVFHKVADLFIKKKTDFVYGYGYSYHSDSKEFELIKVLPFLDFFMKIPSLIQPSAFWSSKIHQPVWEKLNCSLDFELWLRLVKGNKRQLIKAPLSVATVHEDAKTHDPKMVAKWQEDHENIWSAEGHGEVFEWKRINFLNRCRMKLYKLLRLI
ncbi:glycosyltransferase [Mucilaginibacter corticis]|uniref:Glycosyltransferase n=1 Tax=Mucilaginibacter corticis TaxID=2597670 RepID=A0A556M7U9_9SPHI|nr:glycosyltransferase [Mucilaginibacter corticis]